MKVRGLWQRIALAVGGLVVFEAAARIVAPGLNGEALTNYLRNGGGSWLVTLYNQLGGGALVRGGALALGIMPFITAKIIVRLTRAVSPEAEQLSRTADGRASLTRWTRVLTTALALVQSYGFARFVQGVPGAVDNPGFGFIGQTMLVLTTGSLVAMAVTERIARAVADDDDSAERLEADAGQQQERPRLVTVGRGDRIQLEVGEAVDIPRLEREPAARADPESGADDTGIGRLRTP